jgi:hypothetical protein
LVGKPELSIEKKIEMAESSLEKQIDALQDEITNGQIEFKKRPGTLQSKKLTEREKRSRNSKSNA